MHLTEHVKLILLFQGVLVLLGLLPRTSHGFVATDPSAIKRRVSAQNFTNVRARNPDNFPDFVSYAADPEQKERELRQLERGFLDAMFIARMAAWTYDSCADMVFARYFSMVDGAPDPNFVKGVFRAVANLPQELPQADIRNHPPSPFNPKFRYLTISAGDHAQNERTGRQCHDLSERTIAYINQERLLGRHPSDDNLRTYISICPDGMRFPTLREIYDAGRGCVDLGTHDSGLMASLGSQILHELMHWRFLTEDAPGFDAVIGPRGEVAGEDDLNFKPEDPYDAQIYDYPDEDPDDEEPIMEDDDPPNGYGPVHSQMLVGLDPARAVYNADNYRWYAQSKFWQYRCGRGVLYPFGPAQDNDADGDGIRLRGD